MFRRTTVILALVAMLAGCGGGVGLTTTTTTAAPATTAAPTTTTTRTIATTTTAPATTSTTGPPEGLTLGDLMAPIEVLDGFRYATTAVDDKGDNGVVTEGVFLAPDALNCTIRYPNFINSPTLGTFTAIGSLAWWADDMGSNAHERSDEFVTEGLGDCPGAPEFWERPLMSEGVLAFGEEEPGADIAGFPTTRITLTSLDDEVVLDEAALWVTEDGWPIKMEVRGTAPGGVARLQGWETADLGTAFDFTLGFELTDIDLGSLMVRSPDGSASAGPLGGVVVSLPELGPLSLPLGAAVDAALRRECVSTNTPLAVLEPLGMEAGLGNLEVVGSYEGLEGAVQVSVGSFFPANEGDRVVTTDGRDEARRVHALLFYGHVAPVVAFFHNLDMMEASFFPLDEGGRLDLAVWSGTDETSARVATWDAARIRFADGTGPEMSPSDLMHFAYGELLDDQLAEEAWERAETFAAAAVEVIPALASGDLQALVDMRAIGDQLEEMRAVGCVLLGHQWQINESMMGQSLDASVAIPIMAKELEAQSLLLFLDYLQVMVAYLERPEVDWLEAEGVVLEDTVFPEDSAGEYLTIITRAARDAYAVMGAFDM